MTPDVTITDLRSALDRLRAYPGQLLETDHEVDPIGELAGVYRRIGAGGTVERPTRVRPAMIFRNIKGYPDSRVLVGMLASRERVGILLDTPPRELTQRFFRAREEAIAPTVLSDGAKAPCQEVVHRADDEGFDLRKICPRRPTPTKTPARTSAWGSCSAATRRASSAPT
jgi:4-hydroxy-3-polyprenylbenzoate decarboxylase